MAKTETKYHHGNLRQTLLDEALKRLQSGNGLDLSLRELARGCGVSPNAPYRHFKTKDALLSALAAYGFEVLSERLKGHHVEGPVKQFRELAQLYTGFAKEHPSLFRLMFSTGLDSGTSDSPLHQARQRCFGQMAESVRIAMGELVVNGKVRQNTVAAWSLFYGHSLLALDNSYPMTEAPEEVTGKDIARVLARGLRD